jgi:hypothetical protein
MDIQVYGESSLQFDILALAARDPMQFDQLKWHEFITLLGSAAARGQPPAMPVIGFVRSNLLETHLVTAFRRGLKKTGFVEGQNIAVEYRSADNQSNRLPTLVDDLIRRPVAVIVGNSPSALAAKAATTMVVNDEDGFSRGLYQRCRHHGGSRGSCRSGRGAPRPIMLCKPAAVSR